MNEYKPRKTCVLSILPTASTSYVNGLSSKRRMISLALRRPVEAADESGDESTKGSLVPFLRLRPVRLGTVTFRRTLFEGQLVDGIDRDIASSGRSDKFTETSDLADLRIWIESDFCYAHFPRNLFLW